jgi:hypothetical protein
MKHETKLKWMAEWVIKNNAQITLKGECGFGRECVGLLVNDTYPDYDEDVWVPEDAYHKYPCVAVLGRGRHAESQLYDWLKWFDKNGYVPIEEENQDFRGSMVEVMLGRQTIKRMVKK